MRGTGQLFDMQFLLHVVEVDGQHPADTLLLHGDSPHAIARGCPILFHFLGRNESALRQGLLRKRLYGFAGPLTAAYGVT